MKEVFEFVSIGVCLLGEGGASTSLWHFANSCETFVPNSLSAADPRFSIAAKLLSARSTSPTVILKLYLSKVFSVRLDNPQLCSEKWSNSRAISCRLAKSLLIHNDVNY